jgi:hypothetical protein
MSDLSSHVLNQLATLIDRLADITALLGPPHYRAVYNGPLQVIVQPLDVQPPFSQGVHQLADVICHESIAANQTGVVTKETAAGAPNPFGPGDQAIADSNASGNLRAYGVQWCSSGSCAGHGTQTCKPKITDIKNTGYQITSALKPGDSTKTIWTLTAAVSGTVSCTCQE